MAMNAETWLNHLNKEQLIGANYALRYLRTSPRIRGIALELLDALIKETYDKIKDTEVK